MGGRIATDIPKDLGGSVKVRKIRVVKAGRATPATSTISENQAEYAIIHRTVEVIGDRADAMRWLGTPVRDLDYATPISLLHSVKGRESVLAVLGRLEHGIL